MASHPSTGPIPSSVNPSVANDTDTPSVLVLSAEDIERTLKRLTHELLEANQGVKDVILVGLLTRGAPLARRIAAYIREFEGTDVPVGILDTTLYRDDREKTIKPTGESYVPGDITGKRVVLVDDVIFRGRTIRAALDALNDYGRPSSVQLLVLLDRGHRELPISPNFVGKNIPTHPGERVNVRLQETDGQEQVTLQR
ncbi:MAG: bifunctional pyr operon transcriptional regulator/uracil phosphoribosyltransferase PyrR [Candidatus Melainabacteria bacterium]|nr:bifunctional pyr operon transcriptional regulator/uracil phosphoribosyltransferase PyrR [Candidatus Melainabacteria bacterium]